MILLLTTPQELWAGQVDRFVARLKTQYQKSPQLKVFSLNYHYLGASDPYQRWDYQTPERYMALRMVEIDLEKKHFFEKDIHHFPDGQTFNRVQFQNDTESLFYDKNGLTLGKRIIRQSLDTFEELRGFVFGNIDFLAVKELLEENNIRGRVSLNQGTETETTSLTHTNSDDHIVEYIFDNNSLRLVSIENKTQQRRFVYDDYQTTDGITFARSIHKYFGGEKQPSFIHRIDQLRILDKIDPVRFIVPKEFGPIISGGDGILTAKEIAQDLYLVTDSSATRNSLFKITGNQITVFGAAGNTEAAEKTIKLIHNQFPKKKIASVYVTHPHHSQIAGLKTFADQGITILSDSYSIAAIKAYPRFINDIDKFKFETIENDQITSDTHFYVLENMQAKRQGFIFFKESGILFQSHFLQIPHDNTIPKVIPGYTKTFIDFVRSKQLKINRIVANYRNNNISVEVMNKVYTTRF
jgi:hypothetical protein